MALMALQGIRGGVGTSSLCAGLGWALSALGEQVLLIDGSPVSQLGMHFNLPVQAEQGWMQALCHGGDWLHSAQRYPQGPDLLPYGQLSASASAAVQDSTIAAPLLAALPALRGRYGWIIFDLPAESAPWHTALYAQLDGLLGVITPDANCHLRLSQQRFPAATRFLINQFNANSRICISSGWRR